MSEPESLLRRWSVTETDTDQGKEFNATCECGWVTSWSTYMSARRACGYHYYVCPIRFELPE